MIARSAQAVDTRPLTAPIDAGALAAYRGTLPTTIRGPLRAILLPGIALVSSVLFLAAFFAWMLLGEGDVSADDVVVAGGLVIAAVGGSALVVVSMVRDLVSRSGRRQFRLARFAAANGLTYAPVAGRLALPGLIFGQRSDQRAWDVVGDDRGLLIGNQTFTIGSGNGRRTQRWGFATVPLGTTLPHIVLDATSNNSLRASNLPVSLDPAQRLRLEGDFDRHFALYAPKGYEIDALYLFTPDIMTRFVDHAAAFDVEIVDDRLLLYSRRDLSTLDAATWEWILVTLDALTAKVGQWRRWRDGRLGETQVAVVDDGVRIVRPPRGVAAPGRRLTEKVHWVWIVLGALFAAAGVVSLFRDVFG